MTRPWERRYHVRPRWPRHWIAVCLGALALPVLASAPVAPAAASPTPAVTTGLAFTITDSRITESSGLARDTVNTVFWTANDSGDSGVAYAIGPTGRTKGTLEFDANPIDVEALAYAGGRLYLADIGDSTRSRDSVRIYVFDRPAPGQDRGDNYSAYDFVYPDGPHDAEAVLVTDDGRIHIVTKAAEGAIYRAPRGLSASSDNQLTRVADAPAYVTDATTLPSGEYAVRTYQSVEVLEPELYGPVARAALPFQRRGESMTVSLGDDALLVGTKGPSSPVLRVPIPTTLVTGPMGGPTPPPSPTPIAAPYVDGDSPNRTGTLAAIGLALGISLAAGLVVLIRDRGNDMRSRPHPKPRRLQDVITPDGTGTGPAGADSSTEADVDDDRTVLRHPRDNDGPTVIRRRR